MEPRERKRRSDRYRPTQEQTPQHEARQKPEDSARYDAYYERIRTPRSSQGRADGSPRPQRSAHAPRIAPSHRPVVRKHPFYEKLWFLWLMLFALPPVGVFLLLKYHRKGGKAFKAAVAIVFVVWLIFIFGRINTSSLDAKSPEIVSSPTSNVDTAPPVEIVYADVSPTATAAIPTNAPVTPNPTARPTDSPTPLPAPTAKPTPTPSPTPSPTPAPTEPPVLYGKTKTGDVNVRAEPSAGSERVKKLSKGVSFLILDTESNASGEEWYQVVIDGETAYIRSDLVKQISEAEAQAPNPTTKPKAQSQTQASSETRSASYVYIASSGNGKKYHSKSSCSGMNGTIKLTVDDAKAQGYGPCGKCY